MLPDLELAVDEQVQRVRRGWLGWVVLVWVVLGWLVWLVGWLGGAKSYLLVFKANLFGERLSQTTKIFGKALNHQLVYHGSMAHVS